MTTQTDIVNLALQSFGSRTSVTAAELLANSSNEAIQANLTYENTRDSLFRMAPWDCALSAINLTYLTSVPGTPENTSAATTLWEKGQPMPPWAYEYQYPPDCLKACWVIPAIQTGFASGIPITTAVAGGASSLWMGGPIRYRVAIDQFFTVSAVTAISIQGTGYVAGDLLELVAELNSAGQPQGAPAQFLVANVGVGGSINGVTIVPSVIDSTNILGGSYFYPNVTQPISVTSITGVGTGAALTVTFTSTQASQRVILTNQEFATLAYIKQITDPNIWDPLFQDAMSNALGADLVMALSGDKGLANLCIGRANNSIMEARKADANEGLTINDVTPDFLRIRGLWNTDGFTSGPYNSFDWGGILPAF